MDIPLSAATALRQGISDLHRTLEDQAVFKGLMAVPLEAPEYWRALMLLADFYAAFEPALAAWPIEDPVPRYVPRMPWLARDLESGGLICPSCEPADPVLTWPAYLGRRYVIEGSALGAKAILQHWKKYGSEPLPSCRFLSYQAHASEQWPRFQRALGCYLQTADEIDLAIEQARLCFERLLCDSSLPVP